MQSERAGYRWSREVCQPRAGVTPPTTDNQPQTQLLVICGWQRRSAPPLDIRMPQHMGPPHPVLSHQPRKFRRCRRAAHCEGHSAHSKLLNGLLGPTICWNIGARDTDLPSCNTQQGSSPPRGEETEGGYLQYDGWQGASMKKCFFEERTQLKIV